MTRSEKAVRSASWRITTSPIDWALIAATYLSSGTGNGPRYHVRRSASSARIAALRRQLIPVAGLDQRLLPDDLEDVVADQAVDQRLDRDVRNAAPARQLRAGRLLAEVEQPNQMVLDHRHNQARLFDRLGRLRPERRCLGRRGSTPSCEAPFERPLIGCKVRLIVASAPPEAGGPSMVSPSPSP